MASVGVEVGPIVSPHLGAQAIVHPADPSAAFVVPSGRAIRQAGGGEAFELAVREACVERFDGRLESGDCLVTSAGTATEYRWVLHVSVIDSLSPDPETGGLSGPTRICDCTYAFLEHAAVLAQQEGLAGELVVASPLLGAEAPGVSVVASARAMVAALRDFLRCSQASYLRTVLLVGANGGEGEVIREALST